MNVTDFKKGKLSKAIALSFMLGSSAVFASDVNFSGFLSVGGGMVDDEDNPEYGAYSEEDLTFKNNIFGLQVTGQVNEKVSATAQLIARSQNDYSVGSEWAYLTYQATENSKIRAGRLRTPFYLYSDFLDVGFAYHWITPPREVYYLPFNNIDGVDFYYTRSLGSVDASFQAYFGSFDEEFSGLDFKTRSQVGVATTFSRDWWTFRTAYHQADLSYAGAGIDQLVGGLKQISAALKDTPYKVDVSPNIAALTADADKATFTEVGLTIDTGRFVAAAEYIVMDASDTMLGEHVRYFTMAGVRAGSWLFHVTAGKADDKQAHPEAGLPAIPPTAQLVGAIKGATRDFIEFRDVLTLGARWDVAGSTAIKFQFDDVDNLDTGDQKVLSVALQTVF